MERVMSIEEKIRRAEEIYERRKQGNNKQTSTIKINQKKDIKLLRKIIIQIILCVCIYTTYYFIQNSQSAFLQDVLNKTKEILSYDINLGETYENVKNQILEIINNQTITEEEETEEIDNNAEVDNEEAIGGAVEEISQEQEGIQSELSQAEQDIINIKNTTTFIKPIEGVISSKFGQRENASGSVPKNHTGIDIVANMGTKIISATEGEVVLASEEGDYGKHLKIQIGKVSIIYAHCNNLYVKQGDKIIQGQEIAEVGSTGNSTGPHLHFEIRIEERIIDPELILEL